MYNFVVQCLVSVLWALLVCDIKVIYSLRAHFEKKTSFKPKKWKFLRLYSQAKVIQKVIKGQLISKCLFGVFNFLQKMNENKSTTS